MDIITTAITTALTNRTANPAAESAYEMIKVTLRQKFGPDSDLIDALEKLEKQPISSGRQVVLQEEVIAAGADQDPALQALAQTLLDKLKSKSGRTPHPPSLAAPLQRPARTESFIGRQTELTQLLTHLQPGRAVALFGPSGVGKSALAAAAVWQLAPGNTPPAIFPDGILYHSFYIQPRVDIALEQMARTLEEEPKPTPYDAVQRALAGRQALLVLDGAEQADDLAGLLGLRGDCGVLLTSRHTHQAIDIHQEVNPLPQDEAVALLQAWGGWPATDQVPVQQICEWVGGLPLAVRLAGQYLAVRREKAANYLTWLQTTPLPGQEASQRLQTSVPLVLEHTLAQVSITARQVLAVVGLLAQVPFDHEVIIKTLTVETEQGLLSSVRRIFKPKPDEKSPDIHAALEELVDYGLLHRVGQRYEVTHDSIQAYARQNLTPPARSIRRLATCYMAMAWEQSGLGREGYAKLDIDRAHFMRVLNECVKLEDWEAAYGLAAAIEDYLDRQEHWSERVIANEVGLIAAWQLGRPNEGDWLGNLGDTYRTMGHAKWAIEHFEKALATARQNGDRPSEANSLGNLGLAYRDLGQTERARQYLKQALAIFEKIRSPSADYIREWLAELEER